MRRSFRNNNASDGLNNQQLRIKEMTPEGGILWGQYWLALGGGHVSDQLCNFT